MSISGTVTAPQPISARKEFRFWAIECTTSIAIPKISLGLTLVTMRRMPKI